MKGNSIRAIRPYQWNGLWVFDDKETGLVREAFVSGADLLCDALAQGHRKFTLLFSDQPFPGHQLHLKLVRVEQVGQTYKTDDDKEAWLCPALLLYFDQPPQHLYAQAVLPESPQKRSRTRYSSGRKSDRLAAYGPESCGGYEL